MTQYRFWPASRQVTRSMARSQPRLRPAPEVPTGTHFFYKAADAAMTVPLRPGRDLGPALRALVRRQAANYERTAALIQVADRLWPGLARRLSRSLLRSNALPLAYEQIALLGYGSGSTVFCLRRGDQKLVLKVYRRSLGHTRAVLDDIADYFSEKYQTVARWYGGPLNLVPPATFLLLQSPLLGCPAVGVLQPYIGGEKWDLFEDFTADELMALLREQPFLCRQVRCFARRTLDIYAKEGRCVDFVGHENVMLNNDEGRWRLWVIDNGIFDLLDLKERAPETFSVVMGRLECLQLLYERSLALSRTVTQR